MLEKMAEFFDNRIEDYDKHMLSCIVGAEEFYPFTARALPSSPNAEILDLGCGTGLELSEYFKLNPTARVTGIDLSEKMLSALRKKFPEESLTLIRGSYMEIPLGDSLYDAAVSVESFHHFTKDEKIPLYKKIHAALRDGGYLIITDYFAKDVYEETLFRNQLASIKRAEGITDSELYHYDIPLTVPHECEALIEAGFSSVTVIGEWETTKTIKAEK